MAFTAYQSELCLAAAFDALFDFVIAVHNGQANAVDAPVFTYLLTPKQRAEIDRVCTENNWPLINCPGILIDVNAIWHPIEARRAKDRLADTAIREIIRKAYSPRSMVRTNREHGEQALIFNTHQKIVIGSSAYHGLAVLEIRSDGPTNYLAPVTCYHATEAKVRAIKS